MRVARRLMMSMLAALVVVLGSPAPEPSAAGAAVAGWRDDFTSFDTTTWRAVPFGCKSAANVSVSDGMLRLTAQPPTPNRPECPVIGARVDTYELRTFEPGTFSARIKFATAPGSWQTFWLTGDSGRPSPAQGEVDIAEIIGRTPGQTHLRLHSAWLDGRTRSDGRLATCTQKLDQVITPGPNEWHVFSVTTGATSAIFRLDGRVLAQFKPDGRCTWPYADPMRIILGSGGGGWAGTVDPTRFPKTVLVDWVSWAPPGA